MRLRLIVAAVIALVASSSGIRADVPPPPFLMRAFAINMTNVNVPRGNAGVMEIRITGWSPAATRQRLIETFLADGQDALLSSLQKEKAKGRLRMPNWQGPDPQNYRLGWDIQYAALSKLEDGGDRIVIVTDRHMSFWEVRDRPRSYDYPFTLIEIHIPKEGKGEGRAFGATQILFDKKKNEIVLEQYSAGDIRLNEITVEAQK